MKIAVASGKGGTGKTTVSTNLAVVLAETGYKVAYLDCDVEEPNGHLFLKPEIEAQETVSIPVPVVDNEACISCGVCAEICQYGAIMASIGERVVTFPDLCHGCGGCTLVCPEKAIREIPREIGVVEEGHAGAIRFVHGRLKIGCPISPPLIQGVKGRSSEQGVHILDSPPGTSCPAIQSVNGTDYVLLVTEPTPFGLHDLQLTVEVVRTLGLPFGVVVNRSDIGADAVQRYCGREGIEVLLEIPDDRRVAEAYSRGQLASVAIPEYRPLFVELFHKVERRAAQ